jgi:anti-sigma-K factor RskA
MERTGIHELTAAYALDALDSHDEREYEEHLARCETCRADLASLHEAAATLAFAVEERTPPPALRERILESARAEPSNVVSLRRWRVVTYSSTALAAAAAVAAIGFAVWGTSLRDQLNDERAALAVLGDPAAQTIALSGAEGKLVVAPDGRAALVADLDRAPSGKAYEVWVVRGKVATPAGLFDGRARRDLVELDERVPSGAVVAVTLEDDAGVDAPTGEPLFTAQA